jgi:predicted methyltransferase
MRKLLKSMTLAILAICSPLAAGETDTSHLTAVLAAQPEEAQARYRWRHPRETLEFFGIEPGMTVVEVLPGGGWYTKILLPYLGDRGHLIGADYPLDMFPLFGFFTEEQLQAKETWPETFVADAQEWAGTGDAAVSAFALGAMPDSLEGQADAVLLIRALHNLARFEAAGGYLTTALQDLYDVLKPGGIVGVVQHQARDDMPDEWASGANGYLKKGFVVARLEAAGFEFIGSSDINQNELDQPTVADIVWRLSPSLVTSRDNPELRAQIEAIGESNRMTLKFRKPD